MSNRPGNGSFRQTFEAIVEVERGPASEIAFNDERLPIDDFVITGFSADGRAEAPVVFAGWGIVSEEHGIDDYADLDVSGRIVLVRRYTPKDGAFEDEDTQRRLGDLRFKAFTARERGAAGLLVGVARLAALVRLARKGCAREQQGNAAAGQKAKQACIELHRVTAR